MNKIMSGLGKLERFMSAKSPEILTGSAIAGALLSAYSWFKAGPKVERILENYREDVRLCDPRDRDAKAELKKHCVADVAMTVAGPVIMTGTTIGCIAGSHSESSKRIAALSAAYSISESTARNLETKMEEILGEKKTRQVKDAIIKDKLKKDTEDGKLPDTNHIIMTGKGDVLCKDMYSGRYFRANAQFIENGIAELSYDILTEMYISLNEFYDKIGLDRIPMGDDLGWNIDDTDRGKLPITITAILTEDKTPCLCVDYRACLRTDYRNLR